MISSTTTTTTTMMTKKSCSRRSRRSNPLGRGASERGMAGGPTAQ